MVEIQICEGSRELLLVECVAEAQAERRQLLPVDEAIAVEVELLEAVPYLTVLLELVEVLHGADAAEELLCVLVIVQ